MSEENSNSFITMGLVNDKPFVTVRHDEVKVINKEMPEIVKSFNTFKSLLKPKQEASDAPKTASPTPKPSSAKTINKDKIGQVAGFCDYHQEDMIMNRNGNLFHSREANGTKEYCNGRGYPDEYQDWKAKQRYQNK